MYCFVLLNISFSRILATLSRFSFWLSELVRLDHEVRDAAVEVPPQKTPIKVEPSSGVTPGMSQKKRLLAKGHSD